MTPASRELPKAPNQPVNEVLASRPPSIPGPTSTSGNMITTSTSAATYREKESARVRRIPRRPPIPYMIEMVST